MLQRVVWNLKLNVFSANDGQFRVYCIALSNVNQPAAILVVRDERRLVMIVLRICISESATAGSGIRPQCGKTLFHLDVTDPIFPLMSRPKGRSEVPLHFSVYRLPGI